MPNLGLGFPQFSKSSREKGEQNAQAWVSTGTVKIPQCQCPILNNLGPIRCDIDELPYTDQTGLFH